MERQTPDNTYIAIMLQSLQKKEAVLDEIIRLNDVQKAILEDLGASVADFDETVEAKSACIDQLELLDQGFDKLYERTSDELKTHKEKYAEEIRELQACVRRITDKSMKAQAQEARNKDLMTNKFRTVREQRKQVGRNSRAITGYYNSMKSPEIHEPQYMDDKK